MIPWMKGKGWMLLGISAVLLMAGLLWRGELLNGAARNFSSGSQILRVPRPEELGRVMPAELVLPDGPRREPPAVSGSKNPGSSEPSHFGGSLIPPTREVKKLQEEGGIIY